MDKDFEETVKYKNRRAFDFVKAGVFLAGVAGVSTIAGFSITLSAAKKKDPQFFDKGIAVSQGTFESGASLALRALKWGTVYAVAGCSVLFFGIWKMSGATDLKEFRIKMGNLLPKITKNDPPQSRTEFSGLNDLLTYVSTEDFGKR